MFSAIVSRAVEPRCPVQKSLIFFTSHIVFFLFIFVQDNCNNVSGKKKKIGVTEPPRSLNPGKAVAKDFRPIIAHFITHGI